MGENKLKRIFNYGIPSLIVLIICSVLFTILSIKETEYIELLYIIITIVFYSLDLVFLIISLNISKRNNILKEMDNFFLELEDFEGLLNNIIKDQDAYKYDQLFLKNGDLNNSVSIYGDKFKTFLTNYNLDANALFNIWYNDPSQLNLFKLAYYELAKDVRKINLPIPYKIKELINK